MSDQFVAEIRIYPFNFAPTGWALCNGQILPISQNTALFSLLGTTYGGNGQSTFALPDMISSAPMQPGQGPGLSLHDLGEQAGEETVTLLDSEMPSHTHTWGSTNQAGEDRTPAGETLSKAVGGNIYGPANNLVQFNPAALPPAGGNAPHNNMMPYLTLNFCIALQGIFPARP
jgi:microcystin-dependent protein